MNKKKSLKFCVVTISAIIVRVVFYQCLSAFFFDSVRETISPINVALTVEIKLHTFWREMSKISGLHDCNVYFVAMLHV